MSKLDFVAFRQEISKTTITIVPEFIVGKSKDLMIRGGDFYAVWDEEKGLWSNDEGDVQTLVDLAMEEYANDISKKHTDFVIKPKYLRTFSTGKWTEWGRYIKSLPDNYKPLDEKMIFMGGEVKKKDYVTKVVPYALQEMATPAYDELMSTLYSEKEREKLEWAIGSIVAGKSKRLQKFIVLYGGPGTGKGTALKIIKMLFPGFYSLFEAKELTKNSDFALESLKENTLIGIQDDGDLSRIEDNTKLNSIVSHEEMVMNEKFKNKYKIRFNTFLFMGTNTPVKITDAKSGIVRRLIDVTPTGITVPGKRYDILMKQIEFELPGIAYRCLKVFEELGVKYFDGYRPTLMLDKTNDFYNFISDNLDFFLENSDDGIPLTTVWKRYKEYCEDALVNYPMPLRVFKSELKNYFSDFVERTEKAYNVYKGFIDDKFVSRYTIDPEASGEAREASYEGGWLEFKKQASLLDDICASYPAQLADENGKPRTAWDKVKTSLKDIDTSNVHYVRVPEHHIVIDFDIRGEDGEKCLEKNLKAASVWPKTYAELSKSGSGIHLHYIYKGDVTKLRRLFGENVEIKVFTGKSSLRRCLTKCNDLPIAEISSGLPIKEETKVIKAQVIKSEKGLRNLIERNLRKEIHPSTKCSIDFIYDILEEAYKTGLVYNVSDMRSRIYDFAFNSTHQADYCLSMTRKMKYQSDPEKDDTAVTDFAPLSEAPIVIFDVEVSPDTFIICYKKLGKGNTVIRLIDPTPQDVEELFKFRLVGFNNRNYDNHILYARSMGYTNAQLYDLSQRLIVEKDPKAKFGAAFGLSYTDIYDYLSAANKGVGGLKKWEIKLGMHHQEFPYPWNEPLVTMEKKKLCADYCCNDVLASEAVWYATQEDFKAREILAEWAGMTVNDTTNQITTRLIVGTDPNPQRKFIYTDLSTIFPGYEFNEFGIDPDKYKPGVKIVKGKSLYLGKDPGEGGYAIGYPGVYFNVAVLDVESMHPHSTIVLKVFGEEYTLNYEHIVDIRLAIKHGDYALAKSMLPPELHKYLDNEEGAEALSNALKTPINSSYGLTSASFPNKLRDPRNKDNIVAKYGALFMMTLEEEVKKQGYIVVHIKTDSIKIANADTKIINFCMEFARKYGYTFEHESTYSRIALMNDAVFIAKYAHPEWCQIRYGYIPKKNKKNYEKHGGWTATGTQFQVPYVFKNLFSHEEITFDDICEIKSVSTSMYLDFNEGMEGEDSHDYRFVGRIGYFCPVKEGLGGGYLMRKGDNGKFSSVNGTKVAGSKNELYRWLEVEQAEKLGITMEQIDLRYHNGLVEDAVNDISKFMPFDEFVVNDDFVFDGLSSADDEEGIPFV